MTLEQLLSALRDTPQRVEFGQVMEVIDRCYDYRPTGFTNGAGQDSVDNPAGSNEGSCRIFAFAQRHELDATQTLACFGRYFREDVLGHPNGTDLANIRTFMRHGPASVIFDGEALRPKGTR